MRKNILVNTVTHCLILAVALSCCMVSGTAVAQKLTIATVMQVPLSTPDGMGLIDRITKERFARIGVDVDIQSIPNIDALEQANAGIYDGDIYRVAGTSETYPNLIQVPGNVNSFDFVAFSMTLTDKDLDIAGKGWESLTPYRVGIREGWVETKKHVTEENTAGVSSITSVPQMFMSLKRKKVDLIIYGRFMGHQMIKELNLKGVHIIEPPLSSKEMFLYIHKRHADLVPKLEQALADMKADGTWQKFIDETLSQYAE